MRNEIKGGSIKARRAGQKGWDTRRERKTRHSAMRDYLRESADEIVTVIDRTVKRHVKQWHLDTHPECAQDEIIDFDRASLEISRRWSTGKFIERLEAGDVCETDRAVYTLESRAERQITREQQRSESSDSLNRIVNMMKR